MLTFIGKSKFSRETWRQTSSFLQEKLQTTNRILKHQQKVFSVFVGHVTKWNFSFAKCVVFLKKCEKWNAPSDRHFICFCCQCFMLVNTPCSNALWAEHSQNKCPSKTESAPHSTLGPWQRVLLGSTLDGALFQGHIPLHPEGLTLNPHQCLMKTPRSLGWQSVEEGTPDESWMKRISVHPISLFFIQRECSNPKWAPPQDLQKLTLRKPLQDHQVLTSQGTYSCNSERGGDSCPLDLCVFLWDVRALRSCQVHNQRPSQRFPEFWHRTH